MFSGIAVFNPNDEAVQVALRVFNAEGLGRGERQFVLGKNQRLSDILENLIPESAGLNGGYIILDASQVWLHKNSLAIMGWTSSRQCFPWFKNEASLTSFRLDFLDWTGSSLPHAPYSGRHLSDPFDRLPRSQYG